MMDIYRQIQPGNQSSFGASSLETSPDFQVFYPMFRSYPRKCWRIPFRKMVRGSPLPGPQRPTLVPNQRRGVWDGQLGRGGLYPLVICYIANWKDPPILMGKLTISMAMFNSYFDITRGYHRIDPHPAMVHRSTCSWSSTRLLAEIRPR